MKEYSFKVEEKDSEKRLDKYILSKVGKEFSRNFIQHLITKGLITVNGCNVKTHYKVKNGQSIKVTLPELKQAFKPIPYELDIIYEDDYVIVVNKPAGLIVHSPSKYVKENKNVPTLVKALLYHCESLSHIGGILKPGIVHRLDKDTSGVIIAAKDDFTHRKLAKQFKHREVKKIYIAIVEGKVELEKGVVKLPIGRSFSKKVNMGISYIKGKSATTRYEVIKRFKDYTLLKVDPKTGRTHQIRVHLAYVGHPILGDKKYGGSRKAIARQALHAYKLTIKHPQYSKYMSFTAPIPGDMKKFIPKEFKI